MLISLTKPSFNAGIWSKKLEARNDLSRYSAACSEMINFIPLAYGGIVNRAGFEWIFSTGTSKPRLIAFQFNAEQSYMLVFIASKGYVIKDNGIVENEDESIYEFTHPYAEEDLSKLQYIQSADVLYLTHAKYPPAQIARYDHNDWRYEELFFENTVAKPEDATIVEVATTGDPYWYGYTLVDEDGNESEIREISKQARVGDTIDFGHLPSYYTNGYKFNIYRNENGLYGWVDDTLESTWEDPNEGGTNPDMDATPPQYKNPCEGEGDYPTCACIHQGRLVFAGSDNKPRSILGSRSGSFTDYSTRSPLQDDDSYEFEISGGQVDRIEWIRSSNKGLLVGSGGGEYLIEGKPITPNSIEVIPQSSYGSAPIPSVQAGDEVLFVQRGKNIIRSMQYSALSETYEGNNVAMLAEELFENNKITSTVWQRDPEYIFWCVRDDGVLLGLTYNNKEKVFAWHKHTTKGKFIDINKIQDGTQRELLYVVTERNGNYHIEIMKDRNIGSDINKAWFLDSAIEYDGDSVTKLYELDHLEGMEVSVFSKGTVIQGLTVAGGQIELPFPVTEAVVGLPYQSLVSTMEVSPPYQGKYSMSTIVNIYEVTLYIQDSCMLLISGTGGDIDSVWTPLTVTPAHDIDAPYTTNSGKFKLSIENESPLLEYELGSNKIHIKNILPLPAAIGSVSTRVTVDD